MKIPVQELGGQGGEGLIFGRIRYLFLYIFLVTCIAIGPITHWHEILVGFVV